MYVAAQTAPPNQLFHTCMFLGPVLMMMVKALVLREDADTHRALALFVFPTYCVCKTMA